jgi:hypothetical protein
MVLVRLSMVRLTKLVVRAYRLIYRKHTANIDGLSLLVVSLLD